MNRPCSPSRLAPLVVLLLIAASTRSDASALLAGYTVSDLGSGSYLPQNGSGYITSSDGLTGYSFAMSNPSLSTQQWNSLRWPVGPTLGWQDPIGDSIQDSGYMNANGTFVGRELSGLQGAPGTQLATIFTAQLRADGTFGPSRVLWSSPFDGKYDRATWLTSTGPVPQVIGIDAQGRFFGTMVVPGTGTPGDRVEDVLYDLKTGSSTILPNQFGPWTLDHANKIDNWSAIDDQGRLLVFADKDDGTGRHDLLLTPDAIYTGPVATPEPSTLAILGVGAAGCWWHRRRRARRAA